MGADHARQRAVRPGQMRLPDNIFQTLRTQAVGQRPALFLSPWFTSPEKIAHVRQ